MNLRQAREQAGALAGKIGVAAERYAQTDRILAERINQSTFSQGPDTGRDLTMRLAGWGSRPPLDVPPSIAEMDEAQARAAWSKLNADKALYGQSCDPAKVGLLPPGPFNACVARFNELNVREAELRAQLKKLGIPIEGEAPVAAPEPPFPPPTRISGTTEHGGQQAQGRDGHGVSDVAMNDAVANPVEPPVFQDNGTYMYTGKDAVVILNEEGKVVTTWARNQNGWRTP